MDKCYNKHLVNETFLLELMHRIVFIELRGVVFSFYTFIPDYIPFFISITIKPYSLRVRSVEQYQPHTVYIYWKEIKWKINYTDLELYLKYYFPIFSIANSTTTIAWKFDVLWVTDLQKGVDNC